MLQKELQWAYSANLAGFDFNPRATTHKANVQRMYKALEHSQVRLPRSVPVSLEDHDHISDAVCFDFAPALLSILQDEVLMSANNFSSMNLTCCQCSFQMMEGLVKPTLDLVTMTYIRSLHKDTISFLFLSFCILIA
jgi:hypothetical protein